MSAEAIKRSQLRCDARGCPVRYVSDGGVMQTRRFAAVDGWTHAIKLRNAGVSAVFDFCPLHGEKVADVGAKVVAL